MTRRPMRAVRGRLRVVAAVAVAALAIGGCGGDDEEAEPGVAVVQRVKVSLSEFEITPANPTVRAGVVEFKASNDGNVDHNLEIEGPEGEAEFDDDLVHGQTDTLEVDLSKPGTYTMYCPVGNHRVAGMEGVVTVKRSGSAVP